MLPSRQILEQTFSILKHHWVYDFFFSSQSFELDQLRHSVDKDTVTTAELSISPSSPSSPHYKTYAINDRHRILIIPSFTTGNITVGFAVNEKIISNCEAVSRDIYIGRIARDDDNGTCLHIAEDFSDFWTEVTFISLLTPANRTHTFSLYNAKKFSAVMKTLKYKYTPSDLIPALIYHYVSAEARPCPQCTTTLADSLVPCRCKLTICRKRHPDDSEREMINLKSYSGGYKGVATIGMFAAGKTLFHAKYSGKAGTRLTMDPDGHRRLVSWALSSATRKRPVNPLAFCMAKGVFGNNGISAIDTFLLASIADSVVQEHTQVSANPTHSTNSTLSLLDVSDKELTDDNQSSTNQTNLNSNDNHSWDDNQSSTNRSSYNIFVPTVPLNDNISAVSRLPSVLATPSLSEASALVQSRPSPSSTSLVDETHPLAQLLHPLRMSPLCRIVAPIVVPPMENFASVQKLKPSSMVEHSSSTNPLANSSSSPPSTSQGTLLQQNRVPCMPDLGELTTDKHSYPLRSVSTHLQPQLSSSSEVPPQSQASSHSRTTANSQAMSQPKKLLSQKRKDREHVQFSPQTQPPLRRKLLQPPAQLPSQPLSSHALLQPRMPFQPQVPLQSQAPLHPQLQIRSKGAQRPAVQSQPISSLPLRQMTPMQFHIPNVVQSHQAHLVVPPQHPPLVQHQRPASLAPQLAPGMPPPRKKVATAQIPHSLPHAIATLRPPHSSNFQPLHRQPVLSQAISGVSHPSTLRTTLDFSISGSGLTGSEGRGTNSCVYDGRGGSEVSGDLGRQLRPVPMHQARFILPLQSMNSGPTAGRVDNVNGDELDERRRKVELRKARNRESAQRSNYRRKMRIEALKDDIAAAAKRELILRQKEKSLRDENRTLRLTVKNDC